MEMLEFGCAVSKGIRDTNDDRCLMLGRIFDEDSGCGSAEIPALAVVCDGCGGYAGGGIAAATVLEVLNQSLHHSLAEPEALASALASARDAVFARKELDPSLSRMCTTIAGCLFREDGILIFHAGDSRVYRCDGYGLTRMTLDHSVVQEMVTLGRLTEEEARTNSRRNVITRCIGVDCLSPDIYVSRAPIAPGEVYLLCSDGLWEYVQEEQMLPVLATAAENPELAARTLVDLALAQGSNDNITVCLCVCPGSLSLPESTPFILD